MSPEEQEQEEHSNPSHDHAAMQLVKTYSILWLTSKTGRGFAVMEKGVSGLCGGHGLQHIGRSLLVAAFRA